MKTELELTLSLLSPIALHRTRASVQYVETLDYIPGIALRGALAEVYLSEHGQPDDDSFQNLFVSGQVHYGDLWPTLDSDLTHGSILIPATSQACKRYGLTHRDSLRDTLLDVFTEPAPLECGHADNGDDRKCKEPLDRVGGYLNGLDSLEKVAANSELRVSAAMDRSTGAAAREMLFTQHTLTPKPAKQNDRDANQEEGKIYFQGILRLADPALKSQLISLLKEDTYLFLGSGRSRGLGEVIVKRFKETETSVSLEERWKKFNEAAHKAGGDANCNYFSLTFLSHIALRDSLLRPVLGRITPHHFGLPDGARFVHRCDSNEPVRFLNQIVLQGWNAAQGLPKPDTVALARGAVLLFQCDNEKKSEVFSRLAQIETEGIGERRSEGFGRIAICYPIHYQFRGKNA